MSNNKQANQQAINKFRKELDSMFSDIKEIDKKCLNKAVNIGLSEAKSNTNVVSGFMRRSWQTTPIVKRSSGVEKKLFNTADYSLFVNNGYRITDSDGNTVGFVDGQHILEKAEKKVGVSLLKEFKTEIERVNKLHDK